jgi:hypothetical protein
MPSVRLDVPDAHPTVPAICPNISAMPSLASNFTFVPITLHDSVMLHDSTVMAVARGFVLPRDQALLVDKLILTLLMIRWRSVFRVLFQPLIWHDVFMFEMKR